jgi:hypothetical protein
LGQKFLNFCSKVPIFVVSEKKLKPSFSHQSKTKRTRLLPKLLKRKKVASTSSILPFLQKTFFFHINNVLSYKNQDEGLSSFFLSFFFFFQENVNENVQNNVENENNPASEDEDNSLGQIDSMFETAGIF